MGRFLPRLSARLPTLAFIVSLLAVVVSSPAAVARQTDVTNSVTITKSAMVLHRGTQTYDLRVTLKNKTTSALLGPVQLAVNISGAGVTLLNADGTTDSGAPYISFASDAGQLGAAQEIVRVLRFKNPQAVKFGTTFSVLANIGNVFFPGQNVTVAS
jgi:hypothetical protein